MAWKRVLISLLAGGMLAEIVHVNTGSDNFDNILVGIGFVITLIATSILAFVKTKKNSRSTFVEDELLDD
jgi:LPXTG-motif cell wall-anchored protein